MTTEYSGQRNLFRLLLASTAMATLAACSGGGDDDGGGNVFRTQEFRSSTGLDQIGASQGYAQVNGAQGGDGVTIAILDDGVDEDHPDIAPNLAGSFVFGGAADVDSQHGTAVAGIAAGDDGNGGIQGVAFNADILAFQVGDQNPNNPNEILFDSDVIASGLDEASARGADIINMSLSFPASGTLRRNDGSVTGRTPSTDAQAIGDGMRTAAGRGALMVVAAGNDNDSLDFVEDVNGLQRGSVEEIGANFPALFAADSGLINSVIVAVAVDDDNGIADFSNTCLGVQSRCIAAPGVDFRGAQPGGGVGGIGSGTSYSAPLVSGAAAVVQAAFDVSPREAGNRLLSTATDLGPSGTDSTFGRGLLNLENALTPQGQLTVATSNRVDGSRAPLAASGLSLGSSMAFGGQGADLLAEAIALDSDNFPFSVDLNGAAETQSRNTGLSSFIASPDRRTALVASADTYAKLSLAEDPWLDDPHRAPFAPSATSLRKEEAAAPRVEFHSELADGVDFFLGWNGSSVTGAGVTERLSEAGILFQPTAFLAPYDQLAGEQTGGGTSIALGEHTDLLLSTFVSTDGDSGREASIQKIELIHRSFGDIELRLGYGFMNEDGGFLGSEASGAFGGDSGGNSHYVDLSLVAPVTEDLKLFGAYSHGLTEASGGSGLITEVSTLRSSAYGAGLALADVATEGDGLSFMVGQPLRVSEGSAELSVPTGRTPDGEVIRESGALDLTPSGREIALEAAYNFGLADDDHDLATGLFLRLNPDHDPDADPDAGIGLKYKLSF